MSSRDKDHRRIRDTDRDKEKDRRDSSRRRSRSRSRDYDRKRSKRSKSPIQSRQVIDSSNKHDIEERNPRERGGFEGKRDRGFELKREREPCRFYQQGSCRKGNACQFSHSGVQGSVSGDPRNLMGREFHANFQSNFNQENSFTYFNPRSQMQPIDNDVQFHANAFLEQLQQPTISNEQISRINNVFIESDDDEKEEIASNPIVCALEDPSILISKHLAGQEIYEKIMKLRGIEVIDKDETNETLRDDKPPTSSNTNNENGGLDDLLASIGAGQEEKESSVDDLFALMGDNTNNISENNENKDTSIHLETDNDGNDDENDSKDEPVDDDMYGDLYGDLGAQDAEEDEVVDTTNPNINPENNTDESTSNVEIKTVDSNKPIIKHSIRKDIPFYLQNMSYDRLNIFNNAQGGFGLAHLLDNLPSMLKMHE